MPACPAHLTTQRMGCVDGAVALGARVHCDGVSQKNQARSAARAYNYGGTCLSTTNCTSPILEKKKILFNQCTVSSRCRSFNHNLFTFDSHEKSVEHKLQFLFFQDHASISFISYQRYPTAGTGSIFCHLLYCVFLFNVWQLLN